MYTKHIAVGLAQRKDSINVNCHIITDEALEDQRGEETYTKSHRTSLSIPF